MSMSLFVTVGSTSFDDLIEVMCSEKCLDLLASNGFKHITFQIGSGNIIPPNTSKLEIQWFRYKNSLSEDIKKASLIIGHAGAGTILESLFEGKPLIVALNEHLMDNHQKELAEKLASSGYLRYSSCSKLPEVIQEAVLDDFINVSFKSEHDKFGEILEFFLALK